MDQAHAGKSVGRKVRPRQRQRLGPGLDPRHRGLAHHPGGQRAEEPQPRAQVQKAVAGAQVVQNRVRLLVFVAPRGQGLFQPAAQGVIGQAKGQATQGKIGHRDRIG